MMNESTVSTASGTLASSVSWHLFPQPSDPGGGPSIIAPQVGEEVESAEESEGEIETGNLTEAVVQTSSAAAN